MMANQKEAKITPEIKSLMRTKLFREIKTDLVDQLDRNGTVGKYYLDLIDDYMDMWITKCLLVKDIQERGISVEYNNGGGQTGIKKNDSVEQRIKINVQMLKLLDSLGIKPSGQDGDLGDDEEM
ncbi:P27 family phage terminase small subunit [Eubacteriaceae bacterium ES2]|nr:P27 family phage terminase small subunit [Eubacteriaceae bacterium ES2]